MMYLIITQEFAEEHLEYQVGVNVFNYAITNGGEYVCSSNSVNDFPSIFENKNFESINLELTDFPERPDILSEVLAKKEKKD